MKLPVDKFVSLASAIGFKSDPNRMTPADVDLIFDAYIDVVGNARERHELTTQASPRLRLRCVDAYLEDARERKAQHNG